MRQAVYKITKKYNQNNKAQLERKEVGMENKDKPITPQPRENIVDFLDGRENVNIGLTKREYFAGLAMQGYLANNDILRTHNGVKETAKKSLGMADALLKALEESNNE